MGQPTWFIDYLTNIFITDDSAVPDQLQIYFPMRLSISAFYCTDWQNNTYAVYWILFLNCTVFFVYYGMHHFWVISISGQSVNRNFISFMADRVYFRDFSLYLFLKKIRGFAKSSTILLLTRKYKVWN